MHAQRRVPVAYGTKFVEIDRVIGVGNRVIEVDTAVEPPVDRASPAEKRGDPDPARDPDLIVAALAVVKTTEWSGQLGRDAGSELVVELSFVVRPTP